MRKPSRLSLLHCKNDPKNLREFTKSTILPPVNKSQAHERPRKKKESLNVNTATPINLFDQEYRFFESRCSVNPLFKYSHDIAAVKTNQLFTVDSEYLELSRKILDECMRFSGGPESVVVEKDGGPILPYEEIEPEVRDYLTRMNLTEKVDIVFSSRAVAPTSVAYDARSNRFRITMLSPPVYRWQRFNGVLNHEIGTHLIRRLNDRYQPWHQQRGKYRLGRYIATEEGLAAINQILDAANDDSRRPFLWQAAVHYYSSYMASKMSFVELWEHMKTFIDNPKRRWWQCVRVKRGIIDTSMQGGFYKDQAYLRGAVEILKKRNQLDFTKMYSGKISLADLERPEIDANLNIEMIIKPTFAQDDRSYRQAIEKIARTNFIDSMLVNRY